MTPETIERLWREAEPELSASVSPPLKFARLIANEVKEDDSFTAETCLSDEENHWIGAFVAAAIRATKEV